MSKATIPDNDYNRKISYVIEWHDGWQWTKHHRTFGDKHDCIAYAEDNYLKYDVIEYREKIVAYAKG